MSVSDVIGGEGLGRSWEYDVEGLLDGIIGGKSPASPRRNLGRNAVSTSSSPRQPGQSVFQRQPLLGGERTLTTTITAGKGKSARSIVGSAQRVVSPAPPLAPEVDVPLNVHRPSVSSVRSYIDLDIQRRPSVASVASERSTPRPDNRRSVSPLSSASQSTRSLADGLTYPGSSDSHTIQGPPGGHLASAVGTLSTILASPSGQSFGYASSPFAVSTDSSRIAPATSTTVLTVDLSEDLNDGPPVDDGRDSSRFRGQTIRFVPASPSPQLPPLPNSSPMPTPSRFLLRRSGSGDQPPVSSVPERSTATSRPLIDQLDNAGLGISAAEPSGPVVLGEEINLMTTEDEAADIVNRILAGDDSLKWLAENRVAEFLGSRSVHMLTSSAGRWLTSALRLRFGRCYRNRLNRLACQLYMAHFDFASQKLDAAIR